MIYYEKSYEIYLVEFNQNKNPVANIPSVGMVSDPGMLERK